MSDANRITTYRKKQSAFGTQATGNYQTERIAGETLALETGTIASDEIESGRMVTDVARTSRQVSGGTTRRWSHTAQTDWIMSMLMSDQADAGTTVVTQSLTITAASADNSLVRSAGNWASDGYVAGRWIRVKGLTGNGAEFYCRITSHSSATKIIVDHVTLVNEGPTGSIEVEQGRHWNNGVTERLWSIERAYGDLASNFVLYRDMVVAGGSFAVRADGLVDMGFDFMGSTEIFNSSTQAGTPVAAPTNRLVNGVEHMKAVLVDGTAFGMSECSWRANNNVRARLELGSLGPVSFGYGRFNCEGELVAYYSGNTNLAKYLAFTDSGLALRALDAHGNAGIFHWPAVNWTSGTRQGQRTDDDVFQRMAFMSKKHATWGYQMQFAEWDV
ncbi:MAG TPA: phage tail tube protein [Planctomycetota bacterium]|nr:phage tail tube protein [Planctomycetota bacterium]